MIVDQHIEDYTIYKERRKKLIQLIKEQYGIASGIILLSADFENHKHIFLQESSFFYFTGLTEPGVVLLCDIDNELATLFIPSFKAARSQWIASACTIDSVPADFGVDALSLLGDSIQGYSIAPYVAIEAYSTLIAFLTQAVASGPLFTVCPLQDDLYITQRFLLSRLCTQAPSLISKIKDISPLIALMRRVKDIHEIAQLQQAVEVTLMAQEAAMEAIADDMTESEVQAALEYVITASQSTCSFPSIVGSGKNSVILHYTNNSDVMRDGDMVVVDIGAQVDGYCADITRTYPVSGKFTKRQKEVYALVLQVQNYIAHIAAPGYWLSNAQEPEKSLHHLAKKYLADHGGYDIYFTHGIGHFLGLDVHDVGDSTQPLMVGDVITIEPGIYIPEENMGIRIEDNYWIVKGGAVCLSDDIAKSIEDIEYAMSNKRDKSNHSGHGHAQDEECAANIH